MQPVKSGTQTRAAEAYSKIRRAILDLDFLPGTPLSEAQLAEAYKISRTPVREALKLLEREGLVRVFPARGTFVAELAYSDVVEIYEVRLLLESFAATVATSRLTKEELTSLFGSMVEAERALERGEIEEACLLDIQLHRSIVMATGNQRIRRILSQMDDQVHRIRMIALRDPERIRQTLVEHKRIIAALMERDSERAGVEMRDHLRAACANALRVSASQRAHESFTTAGLGAL